MRTKVPLPPGPCDGHCASCQRPEGEHDVQIQHARSRRRRRRRDRGGRSSRSAREGRGPLGSREPARAAATSKLKLSAEDGGIEVEFEVDQNRNGVPWRVTLRRNGVLVASTVATTRAPSGSFTVRRVVRDNPGARIASSPLRRARVAPPAGPPARSDRARRWKRWKRHPRVALPASAQCPEHLDVTRVGEQGVRLRRPSPTAPRRPRSRSAALRRRPPSPSSARPSAAPSHRCTTSSSSSRPSEQTRPVSSSTSRTAHSSSLSPGSTLPFGNVQSSYCGRWTRSTSTSLPRRGRRPLRPRER